jgi:hypothetical protein
VDPSSLVSRCGGPSRDTGGRQRMCHGCAMCCRAGDRLGGRRRPRRSHRTVSTASLPLAVSHCPRVLVSAPSGALRRRPPRTRASRVSVAIATCPLAATGFPLAATTVSGRWLSRPATTSRRSVAVQAPSGVEHYGTRVRHGRRPVHGMRYPSRSLLLNSERERVDGGHLEAHYRRSWMPRTRQVDLTAEQSRHAHRRNPAPIGFGGGP